MVKKLFKLNGVVVHIPHFAHMRAYVHLPARIIKRHTQVLTALIALAKNALGFAIYSVTSSAAITKLDVIRAPNAQPATLRLKTPVTTAK